MRSRTHQPYSRICSFGAATALQPRADGSAVSRKGGAETHRARLDAAGEDECKHIGVMKEVG
jgi:hypothetical protein